MCHAKKITGICKSVDSQEEFAEVSKSAVEDARPVSLRDSYGVDQNNDT